MRGEVQSLSVPVLFPPKVTEHIQGLHCYAKIETIRIAKIWIFILIIILSFLIAPQGICKLLQWVMSRLP